MTDPQILLNDYPETIVRVPAIMNQLQSAIKRQEPFSLIRFGDGGLKIIHAIKLKLYRVLEVFLEKEGIPPDKIDDVIKLWSYFANQADYIDCPDVYFRGRFWPRIKSEHKRISQGTERKLRMWKELYRYIGITNESYCNPEINYLCLIRDRRKSIFDIMKLCKSVCFITAIPDAVKALRKEGYNVELLEIVKQHQHHYYTCFSSVVETITEKAKKYDLWLVSAGELGRIYTGLIKENGGRAFDIGFVAELWAGEPLHPRLEPFLKKSAINRLYLQFTEHGIGCNDFI
jgi:hypothetical protein